MPKTQEQVLEDCGLWVRPGDSEAFVEEESGETPADELKEHANDKVMS
jgi:hypothetical protein